MTLIRTQKSFFYHIPKTGGVWVENVIKECIEGRKYAHIPRSGVKNDMNLYYGHKCPSGVHNKYKKNRFSFAFVRHPLSWYRSFWCYRMKYGWRGRSLFPADEQWSSDPNRWIWRLTGAFPGGFLTKLYKMFVGDNGDELGFVGKQENLVDDLITALRLAGEDFDEKKVRGTPKVNTTNNHHLWRISQKNESKILSAEKWILNKYYA